MQGGYFDGIIKVRPPEELLLDPTGVPAPTENLLHFPSDLLVAPCVHEFFFEESNYRAKERRKMVRVEVGGDGKPLDALHGERDTLQAQAINATVFVEVTRIFLVRLHQSLVVREREVLEILVYRVLHLFKFLLLLPALAFGLDILASEAAIS